MGTIRRFSRLSRGRADEERCGRGRVQHARDRFTVNEVATLWLRIAFQELRLAQVSAFAPVENLRSLRVLDTSTAQQSILLDSNPVTAHDGASAALRRAR